MAIVLNPIEARSIGCLMEKSITTRINIRYRSTQ